MDHHLKPPPGFFPHFLSLVLFLVILVGVFFSFTRLYPLIISSLKSPSIQPQKTTTEDLAPFIRGILSGQKTSSLASSYENKPLSINRIEGYQHGIAAALLASRNWYDLDRQLFRIEGIELGFQVALDSSKDFLERSTLAYQITLLQKIEAALQVNLEEMLSLNQENRRRVLENYFQGLQNLHSEALIESSNLERVIAEANSELQAAEESAIQHGDTFLSDTKNFVTENIDQNLGLLLEARKNADEARVRILGPSQVFARLTPLIKRLDLLITAIQANFEALATGIKVAPTPGVNLPIYKD